MSKPASYALVIRQLEALLEGETDPIAKMANMAAVLHESFGFWWTGFYRVAGEELILGPFQGPVACMHIPFGRGVCGTAWKRNETVVVPDVEAFPGHIACSSASRSEIVVPVHGTDGAVVAVLDIDSERLGTFDEVDKEWLEKIVSLLAPVH
ncbi:MAG: GAF domain-containing protein [Bacteroidales bacterium]|nr:GAF domain-containing protein [Bacteroidales bacterium]